MEKELELLAKSNDDTSTIISGYDDNDFLKAIQGSLQATQAVLKSVVDVVVGLKTKVEGLPAAGVDKEALMKSMNTEMSEVLGSIEKAMTAISDRLTVVERSPADRSSALLKSDAVARFSKFIDNRFDTTTQEQGPTAILKSASKGQIVGMLLKGAEAKAIKGSSVTRFEAGGISSLYANEIDYVAQGLKQ